MEQGFITVPVLFAGSIPMRLTFYAKHLLLRWGERGGMKFENAQDCARFTASFFEDPRLLTVYERAPKLAHVALFIESAETVFFLQNGTKYDADEVKVATLFRRKEGTKVLVDEDDLCYILPKEGKLRFGKERKFFEWKRRPKIERRY